MNVLLLIPFTVLVVFVASLMIPKLVLSYRLTDDEVQLLWLRVVPIGWIKFKNIHEIYRYDFATGSGVIFPGRWQNKPFGDQVVIRKKTGISKAVLLTPDDIDGFIEKVQRKIGSSNGTKKSY